MMDTKSEIMRQYPKILPYYEFFFIFIILIFFLMEMFFRSLKFHSTISVYHHQCSNIYFVFDHAYNQYGGGPALLSITYCLAIWIESILNILAASAAFHT